MSSARRRSDAESERNGRDLGFHGDLRGELSPPPRSPQLGPRGERASGRQQLAAIKDVWGTVILFLLGRARAAGR